MFFWESAASLRIAREGDIANDEVSNDTHLPIAKRESLIMNTNASSLFMKKIYYDPPCSPWETEKDIHEYLHSTLVYIIHKTEEDASFWEHATARSFAALFRQFCGNSISSYIGLAISKVPYLKELKQQQIYSPHLPICFPVYRADSSSPHCYFIPFIRLKRGKAVPFNRPFVFPRREMGIDEGTPPIGVSIFPSLRNTAHTEDTSGS